MDELKDLIKKELVVKQEITPDDVKFFKEFLRITEDGRVFVLLDTANATSTDLLHLYLTGKKLANIAGLASTAEAELGEIVKQTNLPQKVVAARLTESIARTEIVRRERGRYEITIVGIKSLRDRLSRRLETLKEKKQVD
ncbi:MAG: hypothetical protein QXF45_07545 [Candidatus Caldarchaeum sp.]